MVNFVLIAVCIIAGMVFKATKSIHPDAHKGINTWILYLALPAVSFKYLPKLHWTNEMLFPIIATFLTSVFCFFFMMFYSRSRGYSRRSRSTLELVSGYSNTSFLGFPLISAFYGESLLSIAYHSSHKGRKPIWESECTADLKTAADLSAVGGMYCRIDFISVHRFHSGRTFF